MSRRLSRRVQLSGEEGMGVLVSILCVLMMLTLSGVALSQAVHALHLSSQNTDEKRALQAADAAIDAATYAVSRATIGDTLDIDPLNPATIVNQNCVVTVGSIAGVDLGHPDIDSFTLDPATSADPSGTKWCPPSQSQTTSDNATYSFRVSQLLRAGGATCGSSSLINLDRYVVGVGRAGNKVRRVRADLKASISLLSGAAVQSSSAGSPLAMSGTARILGNAETNGSITGSVTNSIAGNAYYGSGKSVSAGLVVTGTKGATCSNFTIPDIDQGTVTTTNDNSQIAESCADVTALITLPCKPPLLPKTGSATYDAAHRTLTVTGNGVATLSGHNYSFCSIVVKGNGVLEIPASNTYARLFLDDPANCAGVTNPGTISVSESGRIVNCHPQGNPETLQIYGVGNATIATTQTFAATGLLTASLRSVLCGATLSTILGEPMTVIAPYSTIALSSATAISGQVAGQVVTMSGTSSVNPINALVNLSRLGANPILPLYKPTDYTECTGKDFIALPAADPSQGC